MKHNLLRLSLKKPKDSSIKTPLPLPYINVVGQKFVRSIVLVQFSDLSTLIEGGRRRKTLQRVVVSIYFLTGCRFEEQKGTRYIRGNVYFGITVFSCLL